MDGEDIVLIPVGDEELLIGGGRGHLPKQCFRRVNIPTDPDNPPKHMGTSQPHLRRHKTALGEPEQKHLIHRKPHAALILQEFRDQADASLNTWLRVVINVIPTVPSHVVVRGIHQQVIHLRYAQLLDQGTIAFEAVPQSMHHHHQILRIPRPGWNKIMCQHQLT